MTLKSFYPPRLPIRKRLAHGKLVTELMINTLETYEGSFELNGTPKMVYRSGKFGGVADE